MPDASSGASASVPPFARLSDRAFTPSSISIFTPLFFNASDEKQVSPFYLYVNVTTPEMLRKVLANPKKYAPSGVYIVRIHGTFVNFLDLSPDIQEDIIRRLDPCSTAMAG